MKKIYLVLISMLLFTGAACFAQDEEQNITPPKWICNKGYWVVESNVNTPRNSIIYFYNKENTLIYKERIEGMKINVKRTKHLMCLKKVLQASSVAWEKEPRVRENEMLVSVALH